MSREDMTESELQEYLDAIDRLQTAALGEPNLLDEMRDEHGYLVEGCYHTRPAPTSYE